MRSFCCYSLRDGAAVIGMVFMLASTVIAILEAGFIAEWKPIRNRIADQTVGQLGLPGLIISLSFTITYLAFSVLLIKGVKHEHSWDLLPWLLWTALYQPVSVAWAIYALSLRGVSTVERVTSAVLVIAAEVAWGYCAVCILAYYVLLRKKNVSSRRRKSECTSPQTETESVALTAPSIAITMWT